MLSLRMNEIIKQNSLLDFYFHNVSAGIDCCKKKVVVYSRYLSMECFLVQ